MPHKLWRATLIISLIAPAYGGIPRQSNRDSYLVSGRVVDKQGHPVENANVDVAFVDEEYDLLSLVVSCKSGPDGKFILNLGSYSSMREPTLFVTTERSQHVYFPLAPLFPTTSEKHSLLMPGRRIQINRQGTDLGDVPLQASYRQLVLKLRDSSGEPLIRGLMRERGLTLRVRDNLGNVVSEGRVRDDAISKDQSTVAIGLPEGDWYIEAAADIGDKSWSKFGSPVAVRLPGELIPLTMSAIAIDNSSGVVQAQDSYSRESALHELGRRGLAFTGDAFVDQARLGNTETIGLFLIAGVNPDTRDAHGGTATMAAVQGDFKDILIALLDRGADLNARNVNAGTALHAAVICNRTGIVKLMIEKGADVNVKDELGNTPLIYASANPDSEITGLLLAAGADVAAENAAGKTALVWATKVGRPDIADQLRRAGAKR